jgi:glycosyltransferase involved in cell wall biosynthesis
MSPRHFRHRPKDYLTSGVRSDVRIVHAVHRYFPATGGTERMAQALVEGLARRGHSVTVVTQLEPGSPAEETVGGVEVRRLRTTERFGIRFPSGYHRWLRSTGIDLFHLHGNRIWCADFFLPIARLYPWPKVWTGHSFYQYAVRPTVVDKLYFERYIPWAARAFDRYAAHSRLEYDQITRWGMPKERVRIIPSGFQPNEFREAPAGVAALRASWGFSAPHVLVFAGGFFENKRVDRLIEAVARTQGHWGLLVLGRDVPGNPHDLAASLALARRREVELVHPGLVPRRQAIDTLQAADAIGLASDYEGYGLLLLEALGAGKPFIAWRIGAGPELAEATRAGFVVDSVEEFAQRLRELEDPLLAQELSARSRAAAPDYSDERLVDRYEALYRDVLRSRRSGPRLA